MRLLFQAVFIYILLCSSFSRAQRANYNEVKVTYNHIVDSTNSDTKKVMLLFETYMKSRPQEKNKSPYWSKESQEKHKNFDFLEGEFSPSLYMGYDVHVLSIKNNNGLYTIKAQFSYCQGNETPYVLAIVDYIAIKEKGYYVLDNALTYNRKKWECRTVGYVDFYYPKYHSFNQDNAIKLNKFIDEICLNLNVKPKRFEYYLADEYDEIQRLKGIDYYVGMGGATKPSGIALDDKVYCGGLGENYYHEVYHIQIDQHYPNKHFWVTEGMAVFVSNSSRGKDLKWHLKRLDAYFQNNQEVDLNNMLEYSNYDEYTAYHYALGGFIMNQIYEKGGWPLVLKMMNSGVTKEAYYDAVEKYLGVKKSDLNEYIRTQICHF